MVMTGASAMMNNAANQGMMAPGVMMDMGMMGAMGPIGMNGDMAAAISGQMMQSMIPSDGSGQGGQQGGPGGTVTQDVGMMQDNAFNPANAAAGSGMMNIGMSGDYVIQVRFNLRLLLAGFLIFGYRTKIPWYNKCIQLWIHRMCSQACRVAEELSVVVEFHPGVVGEALLREEGDEGEFTEAKVQENGFDNRDF